MSYPRYGNYQAVVTDISEFYKRGYIRVRVSAFYSGSVEFDLAQTYADAEFKAALKDDIRCFVYMPMGGGPGHGMFSLPQVNSTGIVSFIDGNIKKATWMGTYVIPKYDDDGNFESADVPNDKLLYEGLGSDGITKDGKNVDVEGGAFIFRQKSTVPGSGEGLNWNENRTENLMVMGKDTLKFNHATEWEERNDSLVATRYQEIAINKNTDEASDEFGTVKISIKTINTNEDNSLDEYGIEIVDEKVSIITKSNDTEITNTITADPNSITMTSLDTNTNDSASASVTPTEVSLLNQDASVTVTKDEVNISGKKLVTLSGDEMRIGGLAQECVVTASVPFSYRMEDGTILSATHKVKA